MRRSGLSISVKRVPKLLGGGGFGAFGLLDAGGLALAFAEVIQFGAADAAGAEDLDGADHRRVNREDAFDADSEADAADGERFAGKFAAAAHDDAFERLNALFIAFAFFEADVDFHGVARTEVRVVLAKLGLLRLVHDRIHDSIFQADPLRWGQLRRTNIDCTEVGGRGLEECEPFHSNSR